VIPKIFSQGDSFTSFSAQDGEEVLGEGDDGILRMVLLVVPDEAQLDLKIC